MSGNKLLAENTIRRFMKLASVDTMTDSFISEMGMKYKKDEEVNEEEDEELMQEALVNEVLKRVTKRIVAAKLQNRK